MFTESIFDHLTHRTPYQSAKVIKYLESGHPVSDIMEFTVDVIGNRFKVPGGSSLLSDGETFGVEIFQPTSENTSSISQLISCSSWLIATTRCRQ